MSKLLRYKLEILGLVQGIGFRPALYRLAHKCNLRGFICNTNRGVLVEIQGKKSQLNLFKRLFLKYIPRSSIIDSLKYSKIPIKNGDHTFLIVKSSLLEKIKIATIAPDLATCKDCISDLLTNSNRRFEYTFTNCTNCGPRFTIINDRPYDRKNTSMKDFTMCPYCLEEYENPLNRRYHAQPNGCPICGPQLYLIRRTGKITNQSQIIIEILDLINRDKILGIKGLGGFHLACSPFSAKAIEHLRRIKNRPHKAFALMMRDEQVIRRYCHLSKNELLGLKCQKAPIVLLRKKNTLLDSISPDNNYLGVMLPYTPLHHLIMGNIALLLMTSANRSDEPLAIKDEEMKKLLKMDLCEAFLSHNREIIHRCDDSIVQFIGVRKQILRRSRGFVPLPVKVRNSSTETVLSLGSNLKNTFAISKENKVYISQHMGNINDYNNFLYREEQIDEFSKLLNLESNSIRCDASEDVTSYEKPLLKVFHHHAHMLSVMAEHQLGGKEVLGVICDGTGLGRDGKIWGFEFLQNHLENNSFKRIGHLRYFSLAGGEVAIKEVDRIAISLTENNEILPFERERVSQIDSLLFSQINCWETSSLGRLFDGVSAILGLCKESEYEARAAMKLQKEAEMVKNIRQKPYEIQIDTSKEPFLIEYKNLINSIVDDLKETVPKKAIAWKFHMWVVNAIMASIELTNMKIVVFSGGCFQNQLLMSLLLKRLDESPYRYYFNEQVPPNDGGISLGQAIYKGGRKCV